MKQKIRILVADDHAVVRTGLKTIIDCEDDMCVVGEASNGEMAVAAASRLQPDVVVMDLMMPALDGADATREVRNAVPEAKILILTSFGTSSDISRAVANGASGALMKDSANETLIAAIRCVANGETYFRGDMKKMLEAKPWEPQLTDRQLEILHSCMSGFNTADIARQFGISTNGVKKHFESIFIKLGASTRAEAVAIAIRKHLLKT